MNDGIIIGREYIKSLRLMPEADLGRLIMAVLDAEAGEEPDLDDAPTMVQIIFPILMASITRVRGVSEQNSTNGQKGGRPKKEKAAVSEEKSGGFEDEKAALSKNEKPIPYHTIPNHTNISTKVDRFTPPTEDEVRAYVTEKGYDIDPVRFVSYYASKGWKVGKSPMKDWKSAVRGWATRDKEEKKGGQYANLDYSRLLRAK